jgi:glycosyltransferase involved in cell wall biosynthesis
MNDTFVMREILELANLGNEMVICCLKNKISINNSKQVEEIKNSKVSFIIFKFLSLKMINNFLLLILMRPKDMFKFLRELLCFCIKEPFKLHHFLYIAFAVIFFSRDKPLSNTNYIHCHFLHAESLAARWLALFLNVPYGITAHIARIRYSKTLMAKVISDASICIGDTEQSLNFLKELGKKDAVLIRNGIDPESFEYREPRDLNNSHSPLQILACGTLIAPKGFDVLVEACKILLKKQINFRCTIIGEGEERKKLQMMGDDLIKNGYLKLPGALPIDVLIEMYKKADIFVMPSIPSNFGTDGLPTVLIEAMASGVPTIGTNFASIPEIIMHDETGLLVKPKDSSSLASAIERYRGDLVLRKRVSLKGREHVEKEFNLKRNIEYLIESFSNIVVDENKKVGNISFPNRG